MGDVLRVCIAWGDLPELMSQQRLTREVSRLLGYQVRVSPAHGQIAWRAPSAESADEIAQAAREVLARNDAGRQHTAPVRTERWSHRSQAWRDVTVRSSADIAAGLQAEHKYFQEQDRERSRRAGIAAWRVRVDVPSHRDAVALAGHLADQGWGVIRRWRHLFVGAACEDDAKGLVRELSGDGRADAETAFRVRRVSYEYVLVAPPAL
jgi:hypothetical protein